MVHALREVHRVMAPNGILVDLRPLDDRWPVEVSSARESREVGRLLDYDFALSSDRAANHAVEQIAAERRFEREREEYFPFLYYWDTPNEMQEYIADEWEDFNGLDDPTLQSARSAWAIGGADSRVRIRMKMLITRWKKMA
ncbi:MAG TPA: hypothetical protein VGJ22_14955 [Anaerolineales bacterium]|jgi:hypothetical protein